MDKKYKYWIFFLKPEYSLGIPLPNSSKKLSLYAYTNKKSLMKLFLKLHKKDAFIIIDKNLTRDEVNELARQYQNYIIRKMDIETKDLKGNIKNIEIAITEVEYYDSENYAFAVIESIYNYVWNPNTNLNMKYRISLDLLEFSALYNSLNKGNTITVPKNIDVDIFGSFINIFKSILEDKL